MDFFVVKVKHEGTLRRFNIYVKEDGSPDISFDGLRLKIFDLFKLNPDVQIVLTYIDEDSDVVTIADEDDFRDAVIQKLNPLRMAVSLSVLKNGGTALRSVSESCTLRTISSPKTILALEGQERNLNQKSSCLDETLKTLCKPLEEALIRWVEDPAVKSSASNLAVSGFIAGLIKLAKTYICQLNEGQQCSGAFVATQASCGSIDMLNGEEYCQNCKLNEEKQGAGLCAATNTNNGTAQKLNEQENESNCECHPFPQNLPGPSAPPLYVEDYSKFDPSHHSQSSAPPVSGGISIQGLKRIMEPGENMVWTFHKGIQCDGCGMNPIVGSRYKSRVSYGSDLCLSCFCGRGNNGEYARIDHPVWKQPGLLREGLMHRRRQCHELSRCVTSSEKRISSSTSSSVGKLSSLPAGMRCNELSWSITSSESSLPSSLASSVVRSGSRPAGKFEKLDSHFLEDVTIPDGTQLAPGTCFTKIWRLCNTGTLPWPQHTQLVRIGGHELGAGNKVNLEIQEEGYPIDGELNVVVNFIAPRQPGRYVSYWRLMAPSLQRFGQQVWVLIQVVEMPKATHLPPHEKFTPTTNDVNENHGLFHSQSKYNTLDVDVSPKACGEVTMTSPNVIFKPSDTAPDSVFMVEQLGGKLPFSTIQESLVPSWLQGTTMNDPFMKSERNSLPSVRISPIYDASKVNFDEPAANKQSLVGSGTDFCGSKGSDVKQDHFLLTFLEDMGFNQKLLNSELLQKNHYDLQKTLDDLFAMTEWSPLLEELQEMGFCNLEMNKRLLLKNKGDLRKVILNLLSAQKDSLSKYSVLSKKTD